MHMTYSAKGRVSCQLDFMSYYSVLVEGPTHPQPDTVNSNLGSKVSGKCTALFAIFHNSVVISVIPSELMLVSFKCPLNDSHLVQNVNAT